METLADFATVQYFSVNTLTTAIYDTWLGYGDLSTANALASLLMLFILFVVVAELRARTNMRHQSTRPNINHSIVKLSPIQKIIASSFCWLLVLAGFLLPFTLLVAMAVEYSDSGQLVTLMDTGVNSVKLALWAASLTTIVALLVALFSRLSRDNWRAVPLQLSSFGYAVPGTVLAMAMLATFAPIDHFINDSAAYLGLSEPGLILSGTIFAVVFTYIVRFSAIANGTISSGIEQIPKSVDLAPASLGIGLVGMLTRVHLPLLKTSILTAWLLVFVEAMKELPAVLVLRPFNFETLSTQVYQLIADEMLEQGALGAILIVLFGLLPIIWLNRKETK
jgi:iron(III) transport system permease protein